MKNKISYYRPYNDKIDFHKVVNLPLRELDEKEVRASSGYRPKEALTISLAISKKTWVVIHKKEIEAVFGVSRGAEGGVPWFLSTDKFNEFTYSFAKESIKLIKDMLDEYKYLYNFVSVEHIEAIRWLKWLGFTVIETPINYNDSDFYYFYKNGSEQNKNV